MPCAAGRYCDIHLVAEPAAPLGPGRAGRDLAGRPSGRLRSLPINEVKIDKLFVRRVLIVVYVVCALLAAVAGEQRRPEFLALNPLGKLPTLVDGDTVVTERAVKVKREAVLL